MGFNKRVLKKENVLHHLDGIMEYLSVDAIFCTDNFSREVCNLYNEGKTKEEIMNYINENK
jgi:hypothetical protein